MMRSLACLLPLAAVAMAAPAHAEPPKLGDPLAWPTLKTWLEDPPVANDSAGKVVVHWFCAPRVPLCKDDLARLVSLREAGKIYVIAYINGGKRDAAKLDPVRSDIAAGAVAFGPAVGKLMKSFGFAKGPAAVIVDTNGKIAHLQLTGDPDSLDKRDAKVNELVAAIKEFSVASEGPPEVMKTGDRFDLKITITLAHWLSFNPRAPNEVELALPTELSCDASKLSGDRIHLEGQTLSASVACQTKQRGSYEVRAEYRFGYRNANGTLALGSDGIRWKFQVKD